MSSSRALLLVALLGTACLERRSHDDSRATEPARCAECHGEPNRGTDPLLNAAPPRDLRGATSTDSPGVGAHWVHLRDSATHAAITCNECHLVPDSVETPGHADSAQPAELVFGALASHGGRKPAYDPAARKCSDSWCHRDADAVWNEPLDSDAACGSCHGLPPKAPHPQSERCSACHAAVVDESRRIIAPTLHVNGVIEYSAGECAQCHGSLDSPAPPRDTLGNSSTNFIGVGAHRAHLRGGSASRALACEECHRVPEHIDEATHADGLPAEVQFSGVATSSGRNPLWQHEERNCKNSWCHAPSSADPAEKSPSWTTNKPLDCSGCHALPPPPPHPFSTQCSACHGEVVGNDQRSIVARERHVDGIVDLNVTHDCTSCHGALANAAPAGMHQTHLLGTSRSRAVACETCHHVPATVLAAGHVDSAPPAEINFTGIALAHGAPPTYSGGRCQNTACHGAVFPEGRASGGIDTAPSWAQGANGEARCGSCHGLPPPRPHPYVEQSPNCSGCHENLAPDNVSFVRPDLHVDGEVTFSVPK